MWKKGDIVVWNPRHKDMVGAALERFPGPFLIVGLKSGPHNYKYAHVVNASGHPVTPNDIFPEMENTNGGWHHDWFAADPFIAAVWRRRHAKIPV